MKNLIENGAAHLPFYQFFAKRNRSFPPESGDEVGSIPFLQSAKQYESSYLFAVIFSTIFCSIWTSIRVLIKESSKINIL